MAKTSDQRPGDPVPPAKQILTSLLEVAKTLGAAVAGLGALAVVAGAFAISGRDRTLGLPATDMSVTTFTRVGYFFAADSLSTTVRRVAELVFAREHPVLSVLVLLAVVVAVSAAIFRGVPVVRKWRRASPTLFRRLAAGGVCAVAILAMVDAARMNAVFEPANSNLLGIPSSTAYASPAPASPYASDVHALLVEGDGLKRINRLEGRYVQHVVVLLVSVAVMFLARRWVYDPKDHSVAGRAALRAAHYALVAAVAVQGYLLPAVYGSFMLTGARLCVEVQLRDEKLRQRLVLGGEDESTVDRPQKLLAYLMSDLTPEATQVQLFRRSLANAYPALHLLERKDVVALLILRPTDSCPVWIEP